jgi:hypothetical protein
MKRITLFLSIFLIISCENNKPKEVNQTLDTGKIVSDSLPEGELEHSEINWNTYLKKENIEQQDSGLLIVVKPNYAIFVYDQENSDNNGLVSYDVTCFQKQNNKWIKTLNEQITHLEVSDFIQDKWRLEDINGDGNKDILLKIYHDLHRNKEYICYLQKPDKKIFMKLGWFSNTNVTNPTYDVKTKILSTSIEGSRYKTVRHFRWQNDTLKFIKGESTGMGATEEFYEDK